MAFVGCVMKTRPLKLVLARTYGSDAAWSTWKLYGSSCQPNTPVISSAYLFLHDQGRGDEREGLEKSHDTDVTRQTCRITSGGRVSDTQEGIVNVLYSSASSASSSLRSASIRTSKVR